MRFRATVIASFFVSIACLEPKAGLGGPSAALDLTPMGGRIAAGGGAAPADINFGPYPLSVLGIENEIRRADSRVAEFADGERRLDEGTIAYAVGAIRDWERRYPNDPWIAKDLLALSHFYGHVGTEAGRADAAAAAAWLRHDYPQTAYAAALGGSAAESPGSARLAESKPRLPVSAPPINDSVALREPPVGGEPAPAPALAAAPVSTAPRSSTAARSSAGTPASAEAHPSTVTRASAAAHPSTAAQRSTAAHAATVARASAAALEATAAHAATVAHASSAALAGTAALSSATAREPVAAPGPPENHETDAVGEPVAVRHSEAVHEAETVREPDAEGPAAEPHASAPLPAPVTGAERDETRAVRPRPAATFDVWSRFPAASNANR